MEQVKHCAHTADTCTDCLAKLCEAATLYIDDFLAEFTLRDSPDFDDWQFFQAEGLRQKLGLVLDQLVQMLVYKNEFDTAIPCARRRVALDPLHESAQRTLMQLYYETGQQTAAPVR